MRRNTSSCLWNAVCGAGIVVLFSGVAASAQLLLNPGFDDTPFTNGWSQSGSASATQVAGLDGSANAARLGWNGTVQMWQTVAPQPAFTLGLLFEPAGFNEAQSFRFTLHGDGFTPAGGGAAVDVRLARNGALEVNDGGAWRQALDKATDAPTTLSAVRTYALQVVGRDFGRTDAAYDLAWYPLNAPGELGVMTNLHAFAADTNATAGTGLTAVRFDHLLVSANSFKVDGLTLTNTPAAPPGPATHRLAPAPPPPEPDAIVNISGTYPHLAVFSSAGEIGIGAVADWAGKLWFVTYPPHAPTGSDDKLWMVDGNLTLTAHPASVGGTHANRMIHRESGQLNIGPYFIDTNGNVRVVSPSVMPGRLTATARHRTDPANKLYIATMEEGLYEVDVHTLAVAELYDDTNTAAAPGDARSNLPGNHGKGAYTSQGRMVYANNGSGGSLSSWDGGTNWTVLETEKFTEVTGPGGIYGNSPDDDRLWSLGWDTRSVILKLLQNGTWYSYRLPKGSYTHDSNTGWYTEWPRIREVLPDTLLMHMHGLFYYFPKTFATGHAGGITPISTYLKMPVDYCWWNGRLVMTRDDSSTTGGNSWTGQSNSAPWFGQLADLADWGPPAGFGGPWLNDAVSASTPSTPFLVHGFKRRVLHLKQTGGAPLDVALQVDAAGTGTWVTHTNLTVPAAGYTWYALPRALPATWARLVPAAAATNVTAYFHLGNPHVATQPELLAGLASTSTTTAYSDAVIRSRSGDARTLQVAVNRYADGGGAIEQAYYELDGAMQLHRATNATAETALRTTYGLTGADFTLDEASIIVTENADRFRLPKTDPAYDAAFSSGWPRGRREVITERDMFQAHGTFYELPKSGSGGFRRIRPIATPGRHISDYASWRGLFVMAGVAANAATNAHVFRSTDGATALWFGDVDDLWRMGAPRGVGGPWKDVAVSADTVSDPYLMYGYERKTLAMSHDQPGPVTFIVEVDVAADNTWCEYARFDVPAGQTLTHVFPTDYSAHWVRLKATSDCTATAIFTYEPEPLPPVITGIRRGGSSVNVAFNGEPEHLAETYALQAAGAVTGPYVDVATDIEGASGLFQAVAPAQSPARFYRVGYRGP